MTNVVRDGREKNPAVGFVFDRRIEHSFHFCLAMELLQPRILRGLFFIYLYCQTEIMDLKKILTGAGVLLLCTICTLTSKSLLSIISYVLKPFGMTQAILSNNFAEAWDIGTRILLASIVAYLIIKQRQQRTKYEDKIQALRQLLSIHVRVCTDQFTDLNQQNVINNAEYTKALSKVGVTMSESNQSRTETLRTTLNENILKEQQFLNKILDQ